MLSEDREGVSGCENGAGLRGDVNRSRLGADSMALADNWNIFIRLHGDEPGARDIFEKAMAALLRAENPGKEVHIVEASRGDGGIDVYVHHEDGIDIYQCKFYMGAMTPERWSTVGKSFERAMEDKGVKVLRWFLCLPREMRVNDTTNDLETWNKFKEDRTYYNIQIGLIDGDEIIERMRQCDRSKGTYFIEQYFTVPPSTRNALYGYPKLLTTYVHPGPEIGLIGRDDVLEQMRKMLDREACAALVSGLGGIGKTAVMQQICESILNDGSDDTHAAWIICGDSLIDDLLILREPLGVLKDLGREEAFDAVIRELQNFPGTLYLFMDNMDRISTNEELGRIMALRPRVRVMITSRHEIEGIPKLPLEELKKESVIKLFYDYYKKDKEREYEEAAWDIINSDYIRSHTLLVELVAKAANASWVTLPEFRRKLDKEGFFNVTKHKFSTRRFDDNLTIEEAVMKLYNISVLPEEHRRIMSLFSIFTPEKEIYGIVEEWAKFDVNVVDELVRLGWIVRTESGFIIHQIVRDALAMHIGDNLKIEEYGELLERIVDIDGYMPSELVYTKVRERMVLAEDVLRYLEKRAAKMPELSNCSEVDRWILAGTGSLYISIAYVLCMHSDYKKALEYNKKALAINERVFGKEHPEIAKTFNNMGGVFHAQGDYDMALKYFGKALSIKEEALGPEHSSTAVTHNNIASVYADKGDYKSALEYYGKALTIIEREFGTKNYKAATTYNNIASIYDAQGDYEKALEFYGKDISIIEGILGTNHPETAKTYNNMANVFREQGEYDKAMEYYVKAVSIRERVLGTEHPDTATTYGSIAIFYADQCNYERALEYCGKALSIFEKKLGTKHPDTATTYDSIAGVYEELGDYKKALGYYEKALSVFERVLGAEHLATATTYNNIAGVYVNQEDFQKALEYYGKALSIRESELGTEHPDTATTYNDMAGMYENQGEYELALKFYEKALAISEKVLGKDHPETATTYSNMAGMFRAQSDYGKALEYYGKALVVRESVLGKEHFKTATTYNGIADVFRAQGDYEKALEYYKKASSVYKKKIGENHPTTQNVLRSEKIMELCIQWGINDDDQLIETFSNKLSKEGS